MTKYRLQLEDEYEFLAFGISCHLKDYRVAWHLNQELKRDFKRESILLPIKGGKSDTFPIFKSKDDSAHLRYLLLSNKNEEQYLLKQLKEYDFFLFVEGYIDIFDQEDFLEKLQRIEPFQIVTDLESDLFSAIHYMLFEE